MSLAELRKQSIEQLSKLLGELSTVKMTFIEAIVGGQTVTIPDQKSLTAVLNLHHRMMMECHVQAIYLGVALEAFEDLAESELDCDTFSALESRITWLVAEKKRELQEVLDESKKSNILVPDSKIVGT